MVDFKKVADKAKDTFDKNRGKAEELAEKGMQTFEQKTGKKVPDAVRKQVDNIDKSDNVPPAAPAPDPTQASDARHTDPPSA